jgi:competence transcription factor ComK
MKYEVNKGTLAVLPNDEDSSLVYEDENRYIIHEKAYKIMDDSCKYYGSSIIGRQQGTTKLTGITYKVPIIISEDGNIIFFPTSSPRLKKCCWVSLNNIESYYYDFEKNLCIIIFDNQEKIEWKNVAHQLKARNEEITKEIRKSLGRKSKFKSSEIETILQKSWTEVIDVISSYSPDALSSVSQNASVNNSEGTVANSSNSSVTIEQIKQVMEELLKTTTLNVVIHKSLQEQVIRVMLKKKKLFSIIKKKVLFFMQNLLTPKA